MAMTKQEIFDRVARHLLTQKKHAMIDDTCAYRTPDGLKCAIGCLIPDELYTPKIEGFSVDDGPVIEVLERTGLSCDEFLYELQTIHDGAAVYFWAKELHTLASLHGLSHAIIDELS